MPNHQENSKLSGTASQSSCLKKNTILQCRTLSTCAKQPQIKNTIKTPRLERRMTGATKTDYTIFWLVPNQDYRVYIDYDPETEVPQAFDADKPVLAADVEPGEILIVNFP